MRFVDHTRLLVSGQEYLPLVQGGMGVDISTCELALAVSKLGGVGHISDAMSPFLSDKFTGTRLQATKAKEFKGTVNSEGAQGAAWKPEIVYEANKTVCERTMAQKTGRGGIFINVMEKLGMGNPTEILRARIRGALDGGIDGITLSAGLHNGTLKLVEDHPRFRDAAFGIIVSSVRALAIFLRSAGRVSRLPDYIIVEGPLAGGHLGFGDDWREHSLNTIVREVSALLRESELDIPIIAAGGIFDAADAINVCKEGASAIQVATRFTISAECGLPGPIKQKYLHAKEEDIVVNNLSPTGYLMRMLKESPCTTSNIKPNCAALGYILDKDAKCAYQRAYEASGVNSEGEKLPVTGKMCICYHFMKYTCYTCGHNVYKLKDTTRRTENGLYELPSAELVFNDYMYTSVSELRSDRYQAASL